MCVSACNFHLRPLINNHLCYVYFFFAWQTHPVYPLLLVANRDEAYDRPYRALHRWQDHPQLLAGMDLLKGGTWLGINTTGYVAALTNCRMALSGDLSPKSRGELVKNFLINPIAPADYIQKITADNDLYKPFNLLLFSPQEAWYYNSLRKEKIKLPPKHYALSNAFLDSPWFKAKQGGIAFDRILKKDALNTKDLFSLMQDKTQASPSYLPCTQLTREKEQAYSSLFIAEKNYGTRATCLVVRGKDTIEIQEKNYDTSPPSSQSFRFTCHL